MTLEELEKMKSVDIRTVDHDTLVDATDFVVDMNLPKIERMRAAIAFLRNPYCFKVGKIAVKIEFADTTDTIDDRMESLMRTW